MLWGAHLPYTSLPGFYPRHPISSWGPMSTTRMCFLPPPILTHTYKVLGRGQALIKTPTQNHREHCKAWQGLQVAPPTWYFLGQLVPSIQTAPPNPPSQTPHKPGSSGQTPMAGLSGPWAAAAIWAHLVWPWAPWAASGPSCGYCCAGVSPRAFGQAGGPRPVDEGEPDLLHTPYNPTDSPNPASSLMAAGKHTKEVGHLLSGNWGMGGEFMPSYTASAAQPSPMTHILAPHVMRGRQPVNSGC